MIKGILRLIKKIILSILALYGYNLIAQSFNLNIPTNIFTILTVSVFDGLGFLGLVSFYILNFR